MKYLQQKPGHFWWTRNPRTIAYFAREFSSFLILIWIMGITIFPLVFGNMPKNLTIALTYAGLAGAILHSITWLRAIPTILPVKLSYRGQKIAFVVMLILCLIISYLINYFFFRSLIMKI
jgi:hypothetical protein